MYLLLSRSESPKVQQFCWLYTSTHLVLSYAKFYKRDSVPGMGRLGIPPQFLNYCCYLWYATLMLANPQAEKLITSGFSIWPRNADSDIYAIGVHLRSWPTWESGPFWTLTSTCSSCFEAWRVQLNKRAVRKSSGSILRLCGCPRRAFMQIIEAGC